MHGQVTGINKKKNIVGGLEFILFKGIFKIFHGQSRDGMILRSLGHTFMSFDAKRNTVKVKGLSEVQEFMSPEKKHLPGRTY